MASLEDYLRNFAKRSSWLVSASTSRVSVSFTGSGGQRIVAPCDGWFCMWRRNAADNPVCYCGLWNDEALPNVESWSPNVTAALVSVFVPVRKGQTLDCSWNELSVLGKPEGLFIRSMGG